MSNIVTSNAIENALIRGDLSKLNDVERLSYYKSVCESIGVNALTKPFEYIQLNGKLTLYATRSCTDQLRSINKVSIKITSREKFDDIYVVTAQATNSEGRFDESTGAVNVSGLKGDNLANAYLKAETKAKRRVTLSLCGLGLLDESEIESIADAKPFTPNERDVNVSNAIEGHKTEAKQYERKVSEPIDLNAYIIKFGKKMAGKRLNEFTIDEHRSMLTWLESQSKEKNQPLNGSAKEYVDYATAWIIEQSKEKPLFDESEKLD